MDSLSKLIADFSSLHWWVTVAVFGLLINLASAYLKPYLDKWYGTFSTKRKFKDDANRADFERRVKTLAGDTMLIVIEGMSEQRYRMQALYVLMVAFASLLLANYSPPNALISLHVPLSLFFLTAGVFLVLVGMWLWARAEESQKLIRAALAAQRKDD